MFLAIIYVLFYGFISLVVALTVFSLFRFVKVLRGKCKTAQSKTLWCIFSALAGVFVLTIVAVSSFFVVRHYSLPVVEGAPFSDSIILNEVKYDLCDEEYAFHASLRPVGRWEITETLLTPGWAIEMLFNPFVLEDPENPDYIYNPGMMNWDVYKKSENTTK